MKIPATHLVLGLALTVALSGCAGRASHSSAVPSASPAELAGTWEGVITGAELANAMGRQDMPARLTVDPDGHWTLVTRSGSSELKSTGTFSAAGDTIMLDGAMPGAASGEVHYRLQRTNPQTLYGSADTLLGGRRVQTGIQLKKVG